ncbi:phosphatidylinositol-4-phosphate 5-kinase [Strigomonas culicis]|uniref:Phosphatidylinositol-4-phosphate 5-kinase n=1 Tax=Strigomonas culicis TaxID=28005 RepID=S9US89_9TRYP|nr:phosphatidylinositol-4-phosphate 5-kinase [Strigomonas culicis]|eukprot:EPY31634.1 phosphatidylinositol-4-phosphate 5-kinase [Strigomonas culicis]
MLSEPERKTLDAYDDGYYEQIELSEGFFYTGNVKDHTLQGQGTLVTPSGTYTGTFFKGSLEGWGRFEGTATAAAAVVRYDGSFHKGQFDGKGEVTYANGDTFSGLLRDGAVAEDEEGQYTFTDGRVYVGTFRGGKRHGRGRLTQANGDYYEGAFVENTCTGEGRASYGGGARLYHGLWRDGRKVSGTMTFPGSSRRYVGEWRDEKPEGRGEMFFANGDHYKGDFRAGQLHGVGRLAYKQPEGQRYYGHFVRDRPHGKGFLLMEAASDNGFASPAPPKIIEGYFQSGQLLSEDDVAAIDEVKEATRDLPALLVPPPLQEEAPLLAATPPQVSADAFAVDTPSDPAGDSLDSSLSLSARHVDPAVGEAAASLVQQTLAASPHRAPTGPSVGDTLLFTSSFAAPAFAERAGDALQQRPGQTLDPGGGGVPDRSVCKGWLEKCSIGKGALAFVSNWKRRYFILASFNDSVCLGYYEDELCQKAIGFLRLSLQDTRIVTRPSGKTHKKASKPGRELCVIYREKKKEYKLLLRAANREDHFRWVSAFQQLFSIVDLPSDHPLAQ